MSLLSLALVSAAFLATVLLTYVARRVAVRQGILDVPNVRSSHRAPTPRGGGIAIVLVVTAAIAGLAGCGIVSRDFALTLGGGGLVVAAVGFADDRRPLPSRVRLAVHCAAALWALYWLGGLAPLRVGAHDANLGMGGEVLAFLGIVWTLNLFNFMDGIDSLAASEAVFVLAAGGALAAGSGQVATLAWIGAGSAAGFLLWNWPPARIFLGDVGSGFLGYLIAVLPLAAARTDSAAPWVWLILGGAFFADATVTLARRVLRGEAPHEAHRTHAYQWLTRRWDSHLRASLAVMALNTLCLLPLARLAARQPSSALLVALATLAVLALLVRLVGAGRQEEAQVFGPS
jgi:Fuc2NAc and GlcNAc transferase